MVYNNRMDYIHTLITSLKDKGQEVKVKYGLDGVHQLLVNDILILTVTYVGTQESSTIAIEGSVEESQFVETFLEPTLIEEGWKEYIKNKLVYEVISYYNSLP